MQTYSRGAQAVEFGKALVTEVTKLDLEKFTKTRQGAYFTLKRDRKVLDGFGRYQDESAFTERDEIGRAHV